MPRETLTREQIVEAAIDLLDAHGLEGLNMRALGERLDSAATAVYWHVGSKENLIGLASDRVWHDIVLPDLAVTEWRAAAKRMATGLRAVLTSHPWLMEVFGSFPLDSAAKARHDDHNLAIYEAAGFRGVDADRAAATVFTFVLGSALGPAASASLARKLRRGGRGAKKRVLARMANARAIAAELPRLRARLDSAAAEYAAAPPGSFEFGLDVILDGLEARLGSTRRAASRSGSRAKRKGAGRPPGAAPVRSE